MLTKCVETFQNIFESVVETLFLNKYVLTIIAKCFGFHTKAVSHNHKQHIIDVFIYTTTTIITFYDTTDNVNADDTTQAPAKLTAPCSHKRTNDKYSKISNSSKCSNQPAKGSEDLN
jgi:hypothetical protein